MTTFRLEMNIRYDAPVWYAMIASHPTGFSFLHL